MAPKKKKKQRWKLIAICISPLMLLVMGLFLSESSLSFHIDHIRPTRDFSLQTAQTSSKEELEKLQVIFSQPFSYLSDGDSCYVFISQDQEYVLKFFKMKRLTPKYWLNYIPFPWLEKLRLHKIGGRERARQEIFGSFKIAFEEFRQQTGLFFVHFFRTEWLKIKSQVVDKQGISHLVPLDLVPFVLQKRIVTFEDYIKELISHGKDKEAVSSLLLILELVKDRCQRGIADCDGAVDQEYGFIGNSAVHVDADRILRDDSLITPLNTLREVFKVSKKIEQWVESHYPELLLEFQQEAQDLLSLLEEN